MRSMRVWLAVLLMAAWAASHAGADPGKPVAVRWWGHALVTIETYWNLTIAIDPWPPDFGYANPVLSADLVLVTHPHSDHNGVEMIKCANPPVRGMSADGKISALDIVLDRPPNSSRPLLHQHTPGAPTSSHAVRIRTVDSFHDNFQGAQRGRNAMMLIEADGVRILHCGDLGQTSLSPLQLDAIGKVDVLLIPVGGMATLDGPQAIGIVEQIKPRYTIPIHYNTPDAGFRSLLDTVDPFLAAAPSHYTQSRLKGNTLAVAMAAMPLPGEPKIVVPNYVPAELPQELTAALNRAERANREAQAVFANLTAAQMNHKPSDGTHTARWNAEHTMGTELWLFSSIYSHLDSNIRPIDLRPKQMPTEYAPAHAAWTGAEEARQMERAAAFTRRFAYLLADLDLQAKPQGSPWPLREVFQRMEDHYPSHAANVKKKFALPDWPR